MDNVQIARTILEQLGGRKFRAMTGVKNLMRSENYVSMYLPNAKNKLKAKYLTVFLDSDDRYRIRFQNRDLDIVKDVNGIQAGELQDVFTNATGLDTRL
jgi:hypothetical protein